MIVAVPFYKAEHLVEPLLRSLRACADELNALGAEVVLFNDSPGHAPLQQAIVQSVAKSSSLNIRSVANASNLGFVGTMNIALEEARVTRRDVVILNSDTIVFPGALQELARVSRLDHMIGFVAPRSNNATICSLPRQPSYSDVLPVEGFANFQRIAPLLPERTYAPTAVGFCMLIRWQMIEEFGGFDPIYGGGYNEENDLVCRAGMVGYRAVLANHAFVWHQGEQSFAVSDTPKAQREAANRALLLRRYPHFEMLVHAYEGSSYAQAEYLLGGLLPAADGRVTVAFDFTNFGEHHNGTFEAAKSLLKEACEAWGDAYAIGVIATQVVWDFHGLGVNRNLRRYEADGADAFAAIIRIGQPFDWDSVKRLCYKSPVIAISMLDTIADDCGSLHNPEVHEIWDFVARHTNVILSISEYSLKQFADRFPISANAAKVASLLSVDVDDYKPLAVDEHFAPQVRGAIMIVGNHFPHKFVQKTLEQLLEALPSERFIVIGIQSTHERVFSFPSGSMTDAEIASLYKNCSAVVFPSHYEGFGLPLLHALAHHKPVLVRRMPVYEEILEAMGGSPNVHMFNSTVELSGMLGTMPQWIDQVTTKQNGWKRAAADLRNSIDVAIKNIDFSAVETRLASINLRDRRYQAAAQSTAAAFAIPASANAGSPNTQDPRRQASEYIGRLAAKLARRSFAVPGVYRATRLVGKAARKFVGVGRRRS